MPQTNLDSLKWRSISETFKFSKNGSIARQCFVSNAQLSLVVFSRYAGSLLFMLDSIEEDLAWFRTTPKLRYESLVSYSSASDPGRSETR